jgi:peptide deformylase
MVLEIVKYGHPVLRQPGARVETFTDDLRAFAADMVETMHSAEGVGLAAQQVGRALQLFVLDVREVKDRPSTLEMDGRAVDVASAMPMVLVNPEVTLLNDPVAGPEGCLSFPEIYGDITRPEAVEVRATNERGEAVRFRCGGLLAKAVQHELDHLRGILFIDRMTSDQRAERQRDLEAIMARTKTELARKAARPGAARR